MSRTNIDIDDEALAEVMARYELRSKREAVNFALNELRHAPISDAEIQALRGTGWGEGLELSDLRGHYVPFDE